MSLIILVLNWCLDSLLQLLISCYRRGNKATVECLLTQCHAEPNCTSENGSTPLSLAQDTQIIRLLLQHGAVAADLYKCSVILPDGSPREAAQSTISLFMVGDKGAGKSTLTKALSIEKEGIKGWVAGWFKVSGVKEKTAGIECHTIHSSRIGHFTIYDLAGHREFHNSHDTVIRSSISGPSSGMFLFVIDLTPSLDDLKRTVSYWLSFIQNQVSIEPSSALVSKPYLLAVGSHADSVKSESELKEKQSIVQSLCNEAENIHFVDYVTVDCRYSESESLTQLRAHMLQTHDKLQENVPKVIFHAHCFHVYLISECGSQPGMQLGSLIKTIESDPLSSKQKFLPPTLQALHEACSNINKRGVMLYIQTQSIENSWIIIDKDMLLREINGSIFAPDDFTEHKALTNTGVVPFSKIAAVFKEFNTQLIIDFSIHMEFCREMTAEDGLKLVTQTHPKYKEESHFLFPALTPLTPPPALWQPNPDINYSEYSSCWVLQCHELDHYLTTRFHEVLLLRLAFTHAFPESDEAGHQNPALKQRCTIWRKCIKWTTLFSIDALVEMTDERVILLLRCKKGNELQLVKLRAQVMLEIQSVKYEFCNNVVTVENLVPNPQYPVDFDRLSVSFQEIAYSISHHEEAVLLSVDTPLDITQLVFFEPYTFCNPQCLVDLFCKDLVSCYVSPQFIECISSNISCVDDFCTLLNVSLHKVAGDSSSSDYDKAVRMFLEWQTQSDGTYQCLRQYMDKYSIFSGRNILVSNLNYGGVLYLYIIKKSPCIVRAKQGHLYCVIIINRR